MKVDIQRAGRGYVLSTALTLPHPREMVFPFFADARNLEAITPPQLRFEILTPGPLQMQVGSLIDYRLRLHGVRVSWQTEIVAWDPPHRFVDRQRRGPYSWWEHEHRFIDDAGGTRIEDCVEYGVPGGRLVHALFVARDLRRIFRFRSEAIHARFADAAREALPALATS